jgi:plasmid stabilization system protein ParE
MKQWRVLVTPTVKRELTDIYHYISNVLLVPKTAKELLERIESAIFSLADMPMRNPLVKKEVWARRGMRCENVDNFAVFYIPNESTGEVIVLHVFYNGRNIDQLL